MNRTSQKARSISWILGLACGVAFSGVALEPSQIWEQVSPACVKVEATQIDGNQSLGTGFALELEGKKYILSNRHVVESAMRIRISQNGTDFVPAPSYRVSTNVDLALITIPGGFRIVPATQRRSPLKTGEPAYAIGFPLGLSKSITQGLVNSFNEEIVQFDAPISSGNSGGPLVDQDGAVIGVVTAGFRPEAAGLVQNLNLAINIGYVPKTRMFVDANVRFLAAWLRLADFESKLIADLQRAKVIEIRDYLMFQLEELFAERHLEIYALLEAERRRLNLTEDDLARSAEAAALLRRTVPELDEVPKFFTDVAQDPLFHLLIENNREDIIFQLNIRPSDFATLLSVSIERAKARYNDTAYQIEFLNRHQERLKKDDAFRSRFREIWGATTRRPGLDVLPRQGREERSDDSEITSFALSLLSLPEGNIPPTARRAFTQHGGLETYILEMFQGHAIDRYEQTGADPSAARQLLDQALELIRHDTSHRTFPGWQTEAHVLVCMGDFEGAYAAYRKAFESNAVRFYPFSLTKPRIAVRWDLDYVSNEQTGYTSSRFYSDSVKLNWMKWNKFIETKGKLWMADGGPPESIFSSQAFAELSAFERARIMVRMGHRSASDPLEVFRAARRHAASLEVQERFFQE